MGKSSNSNLPNSKSKRAPKDRDKKKSTGIPDKVDSNSDKGSPNKDGASREYAGVGPESISTYSEQSISENLPEDLSSGLAEDISYKLRYVIHDSIIKARLSGRNYLLSTDIDYTMENLNLDKVYGATTTPNWVALGDQNLYYLDDPIVNLAELAEQPCSFSQPGDVVVTKKWLPDTTESENMRTYFKTMCLAVVSNDSELSLYALNDLKSNTNIGPIVEWFYHFGYYLLSKDLTYDCLTLSALSLITSLEQNTIATLSVSEKLLKLIVRLLLQRLRSLTNLDVLNPMCTVLAILCQRLPLRELVLTKLNQKLPEIKNDFLIPTVAIVNALGVDAIFKIFIPYMDYILTTVEQQPFNKDLKFAVLRTYSILCRECDNAQELDNAFYKVFGDSLCPFWEPTLLPGPRKEKCNWLQVKLQQFMTAKKIFYENTVQNRTSICKVFEDYIETRDDLFFDTDDQKIEETKLNDGGVRFTIQKRSLRNQPTMQLSITDTELESSLSMYNTDDYNPDISFLSELMNPPQNYVVVGRAMPIMKRFKTNLVSKRCYDHSLVYYNF